MLVFIEMTVSPCPFCRAMQTDEHAGMDIGFKVECLSKMRAEYVCFENKNSHAYSAAHE